MTQASEQSRAHEQITRDGFTVLRGVYTPQEMQHTISHLSQCLAALQASSASIRSQAGRVYAMRNLIDVFPEAATIWRKPRVIKLLTEVLGTQTCLVRGLFFDKPPDRTWSLPWHKDMTIAVRDNKLPSTHYHKPTRKAGIDHIEASPDLLQSMLTLRIHLDDASRENGALRVLPGSHHSTDYSVDPSSAGQLIEANAGDVLAMRPLLTHCSGNSESTSDHHRRVLHLEFAATQELLDGFEWHYVQPVCLDG